LIVDDDHDTADTLGRLVEIGGDEVRICYDGAAALEAAQDFEPEVGLIDLQIPQLDGFRLAKRLRDLPQLHNMLLVAVTGFADTAHRTLAKEAGFDEYLVKPFSIVHLRDVLRIARATRRASSQLRADSEQLRMQSESLREASAVVVRRARELQERSAEVVRRTRRAELVDYLVAVEWEPLVSLVATNFTCRRANRETDCWCSACVRRAILSVLDAEIVRDEIVLRLLKGLREH
jgi:DNA-binding response OmpR family regulator